MTSANSFFSRPPCSCRCAGFIDPGEDYGPSRILGGCAWCQSLLCCKLYGAELYFHGGPFLHHQPYRMQWEPHTYRHGWEPSWPQQPISATGPAHLYVLCTNTEYCTYQSYQPTLYIFSTKRLIFLYTLNIVSHFHISVCVNTPVHWAIELMSSLKTFSVFDLSQKFIFVNFLVLGIGCTKWSWSQLRFCKSKVHFVFVLLCKHKIDK